MDFAAYAAIDAVNFSSLKVMATSAKAYRDALEAPREDTPAMAMGRAVHCAVLEPDEFPLRYALRPDGIDRRTKDGKAAWEAFVAANAGRDVLDADEYRRALAIRDAVRGHGPAAARLATGRAEQVIQWTDAETGVACKARADFISTVGRGAIVDLKTTSKLNPRMWPSEVARRFYHAQLAFYIDGAHAAGLGALDAVIIGVESARPYDCGVWTLDEDSLYCGQQTYREWLARLVECRRTNVWPGLYPQEEPLRLPAWAFGDDNEPEQEAA